MQQYVLFLSSFNKKQNVSIRFSKNSQDEISQKLIQ
jgi:hypothetical protein